MIINTGKYSARESGRKSRNNYEHIEPEQLAKETETCPSLTLSIITAFLPYLGTGNYHAKDLRDGKLKEEVPVSGLPAASSIDDIPVLNRNQPITSGKEGSYNAAYGFDKDINADNKYNPWEKIPLNARIAELEAAVERIREIGEAGVEGMRKIGLKYIGELAEIHQRDIDRLSGSYKSLLESCQELRDSHSRMSDDFNQHMDRLDEIIRRTRHILR